MKLIRFPLIVTGMSVGLGLAGEVIGSQELKTGGSATGKFISPAISITMGSHVIKQLKQIKLKKEKK